MWKESTSNFFILEYKIKSKKFFCRITNNFFPNFKQDINNFEIIYTFSNNIILKNKNYIFLIDNKFFEIKGKYKYYSQIIGNGKYLLFDNLVNENIQYSVIDLSSNVNIENYEFKELLNFKLEHNIPEFLLSNNIYIFISIYENNQICIKTL